MTDAANTARFRATLGEMMSSLLYAFPGNPTLTTFKLLLDHATAGMVAEMPAQFREFAMPWEAHVVAHDDAFFLDLDPVELPRLMRVPFEEVKRLYTIMTPENRDYVWQYIDRLMFLAGQAET